jgi:hypothetical protein
VVHARRLRYIFWLIPQALHVKSSPGMGLIAVGAWCFSQRYRLDIFPSAFIVCSQCRSFSKVCGPLCRPSACMGGCEFSSSRRSHKILCIIARRKRRYAQLQTTGLHIRRGCSFGATFKFILWEKIQLQHGIQASEHRQNEGDDGNHCADGLERLARYIL